MHQIDYILQHIDGSGMSIDSYSDIHVDEKWFDMFKVKQGIIKHPDKPKLVRKCQSKRFIQKFMFLCAVARPRCDTTSRKRFNNLIGCWPFTEVKRAERWSHRRPAGTLETVTVMELYYETQTRHLLENVFLSVEIYRNMVRVRTTRACIGYYE